MKKWLMLCMLSAFIAVSALAPVAKADEPRVKDKTALEGNKGRGYYDGRGRGRDGGRYYRGGDSGWAWASFGAAVGLGILDAVMDKGPETVYVAPAPTYVYPPTTTYYYSYPGYTYSYSTTPGYTVVQPAPLAPAPGYCCP